MKIRKAKKGDISSIKKLDTDTQKYSELEQIDPKSKTKFYKKFIAGRNKWCYVAEEKDIIRGFIFFSVEKRAEYFKVKAVGHINLLGTYTGQRKKGIAKLLIDKAYQTLKGEGLRYVKLPMYVQRRVKVL